MSNQVITTGSAAATDDQKQLQWWQSFNYPVYEVATLINVFGPMLVDIVPENRRAAFQTALVKLQHLAVDLHRIIITDVITPLEKTPPDKPNIPEIQLPALPAWDPANWGSQPGFKKIVEALALLVAIVGNKLSKGSDFERAVAAVILAAQDVAKELVAVKDT